MGKSAHKVVVVGLPAGSAEIELVRFALAKSIGSVTGIFTGPDDAFEGYKIGADPGAAVRGRHYKLCRLGDFDGKWEDLTFITLDHGHAGDDSFDVEKFLNQDFLRKGKGLIVVAHPKDRARPTIPSDLFHRAVWNGDNGIEWARSIVPNARFKNLIDLYMRITMPNLDRSGREYWTGPEGGPRKLGF